jgi:hypothetical protein
MSRSEPTRNPEAGGEKEMREEQWQALFAAADPASEASEALLRRLATLAAERDARAAASGRCARALHFWRPRPPRVRPIAVTVAAGLLLAAFALSVARRDRGSVWRDERSVTAPQADAHRVVRAPRSVPRPSMPFAERPAGAWRPAGPGARVPAMPAPSVGDPNRTPSDAPRPRDAAPRVFTRDDLLAMNDRLAAGSRARLPAAERTDSLEARVRRQTPVRDDFVSIPFPRLASTSDSQIAAAVAAYKREAAVVDARLTRAVTLQQKATALDELCDRLRTETGIRLGAGQSVADEKVTLFCREMPLREVMRQLSRPFGYTWIRSGKEGDYRYELMQDLRSQLLEEELRNRDQRAALLALEQEIEQFRPYLSLSPDEARARAERARDAEKRRLEMLAGTGWGPIQIYFRLSPQDQAALRAGQSLIFSQEPQPGQRALPPDLARGVLQSNPWRLIRHPDGFTGTLDADDPKALPLTQIPEARAKLLVQTPQSELGEFSLTGFAGAFTPKRPTDRRGWAVFEGRGPYAVGRSPALAPVEPHAAGTEEPREPALRSRITLRARSSSPVPPASLPAGSGENSGTPPEPKVTTADVLEALHRATGMPIVADFYTRLYKPDDVSARAQPLFAALNRLAGTMRLRWSRDGEWLQFRSATYYHDRRKEVPNRLLVRWSETRRQHGMLPLDDLVEIAQLSDAQLDAEEMRQGAMEYWGLPEWALLRLTNFRSHARFLAEFTPAQRQAMMSAAGLEFGKMTLAQQQGFLSRALQYDTTPLRSLEELAGATLRVDYTQPGWFQWLQPGSFDASRWVVTVDPGLPGRRVLIPPVREKTRDAALQAARRAFPAVTPEMLQAARQDNPQLDAAQLVPQPNQIYPTELDLIIVYIPGLTKERTIRWVRTRQDLNG